MNWNTRTVSPRRGPAKINITHPCPGLSRLFCMVAFLAASMVVYWGGVSLFDLEPMDWADPAWTAKRVGLVIAAVLFGMVAGLMGFAAGLTINVRNLGLNNFIIVLWQFLANTALIWVFVIGAAMSFSLGREEAKAAVLAFGVERATFHVAGTGCALGLLLGLIFQVVSIGRRPAPAYFGLSTVAALFAAHWHFGIYGIEGRSWMAAGLLVPFLALLLSLEMIKRDRQQRQLAME